MPAFVGISGWTFPGWRGKFYPKGLAHRKELEYASRQLTSIEINGTFYSLQRPSTFQAWHDATPPEFQFSVKGGQYITHVRRLKEVEEPLANFLASGLLLLGKKLGPILWQFPPYVMLKDDRFERFLDLLPKDSREASKLARRHGDKVKGRAVTEAPELFPVRHAFELRHPSFLDPKFLDLLRAHNAAFVIAHAAGERAPYLEELTADFAYVRLHGEGNAYRKGYPAKELEGWAKRIRGWMRKKARDVYVYFSNEAKVHSPAGAMGLSARLPAPSRNGRASSAGHLRRSEAA